MTNEELIKQMLIRGFLKSERIADSFQKIDRKDFVLDIDRDDPYGDYPLLIGHGQTISQPSTVAFMLEKLDAKAGNKILDIGSGSGWTTALLSDIVGANGHVLGIEIVPELAKFGQANLDKYKIKNARVVKAKPRTIGAPDKGPFDRILVSAEADHVPVALLDQLKTDGVLVIPVRESIQVVKKGSDGSLIQEIHRGFRFVPLINSKE